MIPLVRTSGSASRGQDTGTPVSSICITDNGSNLTTSIQHTFPNLPQILRRLGVTQKPPSENLDGGSVRHISAKENSPPMFSGKQKRSSSPPPLLNSP